MITSINLKCTWTILKVAASFVSLYKIPLVASLKMARNRPKGTQHGWPLFHQQHCKIFCCPQTTPDPKWHHILKKYNVSIRKRIHQLANRNKWKMIINLYLQSKNDLIPKPSSKSAIQKLTERMRWSICNSATKCHQYHCRHPRAFNWN